MASDRFHHPFEPYDIQTQLMRAVFDCIEDGKVGIFESPTGTGKSLSLICASLTWLREHKRKAFDADLQKIEVDDDEPAWMADHARKTRLNDAMRLLADYEARLAKVREREVKLRTQSKPIHHLQKRARIDNDLVANENEFLLEDYDIEARINRDGALFSIETEQMLQQMGMWQSTMNDRGNEARREDIKVYICSRTHSQLAQFVGELQRVKLPSGFPASASAETESLKQLSLGSRKNLCINPDVLRLQSQTAINERCQELQSSSEKCPFAPKHDNPEQLLNFRDHALARVRDIEELAELGQTLKICPYYASRSALESAEVVLLPYPLLLQPAAREATGISLKGCIVIIDEAHNLTDAVEATHSTEIREAQLRSARQGLMTYLQKFRAKLKGSNRMYIAQLIRVLDSLLNAVQILVGKSGMTTTSTLLSGKNVDQINLAQLARYLSESKLARKVEGYARFVETSSAKVSINSANTGETPVLTIAQNFLITMANPSAEGRLFWERSPNGVVLRYLLLDPSQHFRDVVSESRAVILAGGTMSPMEDHVKQLFPYLDDVRTLSCGHIVPASSIFVRSVSCDAQGPFEYTFKTRNDAQLITRTGAQVIRITEIVTGGTVVFFASYAYLEHTQKRWQQDGTLRLLKANRSVFFDSRGASAEQTFQQYREAIHDSERGALLFSVIGGKLSEGINFSDNLGRCVIVIGMPYPNLETPEWKARLEHIRSRDGQTQHCARDNISQEYAENKCMRAVNQAVGRAIRHKNDWASILLIDVRYSTERIQGKLPAWIRASLPTSSDKSTTTQMWEDDLCAFFQGTRA